MFTPEELNTFAATFNELDYKIPSKDLIKKIAQRFIKKRSINPYLCWVF